MDKKNYRNFEGNKNINIVDERKEDPLGFYSKEELKKMDVITKFDDEAEAFVIKLGKLRSQRHYMIKNIAYVFLTNNLYGIVNTYRYKLIKNSEMIKNFDIENEAFDTICKLIFLKLANRYGSIDYGSFRNLMQYPDSLFFDFNNSIKTNVFKFIVLRPSSTDITSTKYVAYNAYFDFARNMLNRDNDIMEIDLNGNSAEISHVHFNFSNFDITDTEVVLTMLNKLKNYKKNQ